ncbi:MAG: hypothetical protein F6K11_34730, partial [Leptolyngbya sp. SIO3F4]|nr:hypothetical protein [Leptolyngbya sp. SIO3F4]
HLRKVSGDTSLTLQRLEAGSVRLILEGSDEGFVQLYSLFQEGTFGGLLGVVVENVVELSSSVDNPNEQALRRLIFEQELIAYLLDDDPDMDVRQWFTSEPPAGQSVEQAAQTRAEIQQEFRDYLTETLGVEAAQWFGLFVQGYTQDSIAKELDLSISQVYRLREKINYHAIRIFTLKEQPEIVLNWLKTTLTDHDLGLTASQWQAYWQTLDPAQQQLLSELKQGKSIDEIAAELNRKSAMVASDWARLVLQAKAMVT